MSGNLYDGGPCLNEVWSKLDGICNKLWKEDSQCAVGLQALVEEFRTEVDRAEKAIESLRSSLGLQRKTVEQEVYAVYEARVAALCAQLADARRTVQNLGESLTRERGKNGELQKAFDARGAEIAELNENHLKVETERNLQYAEKERMIRSEVRLAQNLEECLARGRGKNEELQKAFEARGAEIAELNENHLKVETERNLQYAEKARMLRSELKEKELRLEAEWEKRRHQFETECEARLAQARQIHAGEIQALKTRMQELYKDCVRNENSLTAAQEALGKEFESLIQEYHSKKDR